ncbi:ATP-binding cassette domain-containing protein [Zoogloea sp.]|uniref:ATP-binding cassette domain-containing protein n=1 Tax=Zoogloea sp. TaxID=49181 RepID=UPI0035B4C675
MRADDMAPAPSLFPLRIHELCWQAGGRRVLDGLSMELGGEGITILLGPNGAGKSVLLRTLCGLLEADSGEIEWGGGSRPEFGVAMVFQQPKMLRDSVLGNVELALRPQRVPAAERRQRARAVLERVGLAHRADDGARGLSGGERQRLALARAWVTRPRLLLLDEPTASLDPSSVEAIERIVREIRTEGTRILMTTHNLGQATRLADDIVFIDAGRVCEHAPVQRFFARPASQAARLYIQGELPWRMAF